MVLSVSPQLTWILGTPGGRAAALQILAILPVSLRLASHPASHPQNPRWLWETLTVDDGRDERETKVRQRATIMTEIAPLHKNSGIFLATSLAASI